jgi:site-specific DNA recombinase
LRPSHLPPESEKIKNLHAIRLSFRRKCDFTMSGSGMSLKKIAKQLNDDGVPPPRETKKKIRSSWVYTAIREMLRRDLYRGCVVWNKRKFKKRPGTNKRISVLRPECDWVTREEPALRIVTDEL